MKLTEIIRKPVLSFVPTGSNWPRLVFEEGEEPDSVHVLLQLDADHEYAVALEPDEVRRLATWI